MRHSSDPNYAFAKSRKLNMKKNQYHVVPPPVFDGLKPDLFS